MRVRIAAVLAGLTVTPFLSADQVVLDNGDRITGKVAKKDGDSVTITTDLMGVVSIKWAHVKSVATDEPVTVVLSGGKTLEGKLATTGDQVEVGGQTAALPSVQTVRNAAEQAKYNRFLKPPLYDLWAGYFDLGVASASGNSRSLTFTDALSATRITNHDKIAIYFNQIYSKGLVNNKVGLTAKAWHGGWSYDRNVGSRAFLNVFDDYENDAFQNLRFRGVFGGGAGFHAVKTDRVLFDLTGGVALNHESYSVPLSPVLAGMTPVETRNSGEFYWGDDLNLKINKSSILKQNFRMFNNLSNTGQYRVNFDIGTDTKITKWISWQVTGSDRYITDPAPGRKTNDLLISSGIRISFTRIPQ